MAGNDDSFFVPDGGFLRATGLTRGPWHVDFQHGGPPSALLARCIEQSLPKQTPMTVARMTVELLKPIPIVPFKTTAGVLRAGRKVQWLGATLQSADGVEFARAQAVCIRRADIPVPKPGDPVSDPVPAPAQSAAFQFPFFSTDVGYHTGMELKLARGEFGSGRVSMWMRMRYPLMAGEAPTPLQRVMIAADSGNGVSIALDLRTHSFLNPDLTVYLHRMPVGEWVCLDARTITQPQGTGLADTRLLDEQGPIGRSMQSLIIEPRPAP